MSAKTIKFPAVVNDRHVLATATAYSDQISMYYPGAGTRVEVPLEVWETIAPFLTVAAHTR